MLLFDETVLKNLLVDARDRSENYRHRVVWGHGVLASSVYEVLGGITAPVVDQLVFKTTSADPDAISGTNVNVEIAESITGLFRRHSGIKLRLKCQ